MKLLTKIELLEEFAKALDQDLSYTLDALRTTADAFEFPYESVVQIWRHKLKGRLLDDQDYWMLSDEVARAKHAEKTSQ